MQSQSRRDYLVGLLLEGRDRQARVQSWRAWLIELLSLATLMTVVVVAATWVARPQLRIMADSAEASRLLVGFWPVERNEHGAFRWSQAEAGLRLFGFEQRAPVIIRAHLTTVREPGQPPAQLTIGDTQSQASFTIDSNGWHDYQVTLPVPPRGDESPLLMFHSAPAVFKNDPRDLGVVLDWIEITQSPETPAQRLPDPGRVLFLVLLGLLIQLALRRGGLSVLMALSITSALTLALGVGIAVAPGPVARWLPNLWFTLVAGGFALVVSPLVERVRRSIAVSARAHVPLGLLAIVSAQVLLPLQQPWSSALGWLLLAAGGVLLLAGLRAPTWAADTGIRRRTVMLALLTFTMLALALRLVALDRLPLGMWRDEARHGLLALRILHDPGFRPVYVPVIADIPALLFYLAAVPIAIFGPHPWTVRLVPALAGALTPLTLYWAARPLFGARVGLLAAALLAVSVWQIALSRLAFAATLGPLLTTLALGLIWRALRPGPPLRRYLQAGLAGGCTGLALYAYHPSRLTPLVVALTVLVVLGLNWRAWLSAAPRLIVVAAVMLIVLWPLMNYIYRNPEGYSRRINQTFIFSEGSIDGHAPAWLVEQNARLIAGMWNEHGDDNGRHNLSGAPMLDPITGVLFVVGACLMLARLREPYAQVTLGWLGIMLIPGLLSGQAPHAVRMVEAIAPTLLLAGWGGGALLGWASEEWRWLDKPRRKWSVGVGLVLGLLALNGWRYFVAWPATLPAYEEFYVADTHIGEAAQRLASAPELAAGHYHVFVFGARGDNDVLDYLTSDAAIGMVDGDHLSVQPGDQPLLIMHGDRPTADQAQRILGNDVTLLAMGPRSPTSDQPEFVIYGRGAAAQAVTSVLAGLLDTKR
jgi:4-amino-4-deoxy-L-arabinose transferase-like glycosyltransferase